MTTDGSGSGARGLTVGRRGASAVITLDRAEARNALDIAMRGILSDELGRIGRDPGVYAVVVRSAVDGMFSAGGDVREIAALAESDPAAARRGLADGLALCWLIECLSKPTVSFIDGPVTGAGLGIFLYGTHRVAGERYVLSIPEVGIGYVPDCGVLWHLARMPHAIGRYLALTGRAVAAADALALGLATHSIPAARWPEIESALADADPIDPLLDTRHVAPPPSPLLAEGSRIARFFAGGSLAEVMARLAGAGEADRAFAEGVRADLARASPTALAATDAALARAGGLDIRQTLIQDYRLAYRLAVSHDFREGVRARRVDADGAPAWRPATLAEVAPAAIEALLAGLGADELTLKTRAEMQMARV